MMRVQCLFFFVVVFFTVAFWCFLPRRPLPSNTRSVQLKTEQKSFNDIKIIDKDLYFIHIPKNAGTYFAANFCNKKESPGHRLLKSYPKYIQERSVAIVRNPYSRLVSLYRYARLKNSMYHKNGSHRHFAFTSAHSFDSFVRALYTGKLKHDIHSLPQSEFIMVGNKCPCKHILRFESLNQDIVEKLGLNLDNFSKKKINVATDSPWKQFYQHKDTILLVNKLYKEDFDHFSYEMMNESIH